MSRPCTRLDGWPRGQKILGIVMMKKERQNSKWKNGKGSLWHLPVVISTLNKTYIWLPMPTPFCDVSSITSLHTGLYRSSRSGCGIFWYRSGYQDDFFFDEINSANLNYLGVNSRGIWTTETKTAADVFSCAFHKPCCQSTQVITRFHHIQHRSTKMSSTSMWHHCVFDNPAIKD